MTAASRGDSAPQPHVGLAAEDDSGLSDPEGEELYHRACADLAARAGRSQKGRTGLLLLVTIGLFAAAALRGIGFDFLGLIWWYLPLLIGVMALHEAGHFLGMHLFGYHDLRMFFIPFFGAAVSGQKHAAPAWQQAIVLLLGPLPGIVLGVLLGVFHPPWVTMPVAYLLLLINGLNLLPFVPLDGGKLLHLLIFARHPLSESSFLLLSAAGVAGVGWMEHSWVLGLVAVVVLVNVPFQYRRRRQRAVLQRELPELPAELGDLSEVQRRALFRCARTLHSESVDLTACANEMKTLHEEAVRKPAGMIPSLALLTLYAAGAIVVLWSLSSFFYWGEGEHPGEWSKRRIEALLKGELKLDQISLSDVAPGTYIGTGQTAKGTKSTLKIVQDKDNKRITWSAVSDDGKKESGRLGMTNGVLIDETPR